VQRHGRCACKDGSRTVGAINQGMGTACTHSAAAHQAGGRPKYLQHVVLVRLKLGKHRGVHIQRGGADVSIDDA
jgi:hypothetical protein